MKTLMIKAVVAFAAALTLGACANTKFLEGNQIVPAAQGEVVTSKEEYGNTRLTLNVKHLAPPGKVMDGAKNYVVWIKSSSMTAFQNVGALNVDKDLESSYTTTVPYNSFQIMVTPEASVAAVTPTGPAIFEDSVQE